MDERNQTGIDLGIPGIDHSVEIGVGGFAVVYVANENDLARQVAVKVLTANLDATGRNRFERERKAMGRLSGHPNIVTVHRGGYTESGHAYLVMEYLSKGSLAQLLQESGPVDWTDAVNYIIQTAGALETAHRAGVVHRDVKPANVLLSQMGNAKLGDFGIARLSDAPETRSHEVTASVAHVAPEIVGGHRPSTVSDVYSLASTLYELLSGKPPFVNADDESVVPILARVIGESPARLPASIAPSELWAVLEKGMAKDPDRRHGSPLEFAESLVAVQTAHDLHPTAIPVYGDYEPPAPAALADQPTAQVLPPDPVVSPAVTSAAPASPPAPQTADSAPPQTSTPPAPQTNDPAPPETSSTPFGVPPPPDPPPKEDHASAWAQPESSPTSAAWSKLANQPPLMVIAAVVLIIGAGYFIVSSFGGGGETESDTSPESTPTSLGRSDKDYSSYMKLVDPTGSISVMVPSTWDVTTRESAGNEAQSGATAPLATLSASGASGADWFTAYTEAGVLVAVYRDGSVDAADRLNRASDGQCSSGEPRQLSTPYPGLLVTRAKCAGTETAVVDAVLVDQDSGLTVFLRVLAVDEIDIEAAATIIRSVSLDDNF